MAEKPDSKPDVQTNIEDPPERKLPESDQIPADHVPLENITKSRWERSWPTIACGAGLFSDGYLNGVRIFIY